MVVCAERNRMLPLAIISAAYFLGSIPCGYLIVRTINGSDVRHQGSGNTGATNVLRQVGAQAGFATLALDAVKGGAAVVLARLCLTSDFEVNWWVSAAALAAVLGHIFPVWLGFRGGKGVATSLGVFLGLAPGAVLCVALIFLVVVWTTKYVSLGSITAAAMLPLCVWLRVWLLSAQPPATISIAPVMAAAIAGGALVIWMHRTNINRLLQGTENKIKR